MPPRLHVDTPLAAGTSTLGPGAAQHVRVLRLDVGAPLVLFDGTGGEWSARVVQTRRDVVVVEIEAHRAIEREAAIAMHLAVGMPANDRMDALVEKATELGAASIQPLVTERSVLRLAGERATKKVAHWQSVAVAACEQCGRNRVPRVHPVTTLADWLDALAPRTSAEARLVLSPRGVIALDRPAAGTAVLGLSGPEGGLSEREEALAAQRGFVRTSLGPRVLRADTAPLALVAKLS